jgi:hypothetical protein
MTVDTSVAPSFSPKATISVAISSGVKFEVLLRVAGV